MVGMTTLRYQQDVINSLGFSQWKQNQMTGAIYFTHPQDIQARVIGEDPADGSVTVLMTGLGFTDPNSSCTTWAGVTWARYERGAWYFDPSSDATAQRASEWDSSPETLGHGCL